MANLCFESSHLTDGLLSFPNVVWLLEKPKCAERSASSRAGSHIPMIPGGFCHAPRCVGTCQSRETPWNSWPSVHPSSSPVKLQIPEHTPNWHLTTPAAKTCVLSGSKGCHVQTMGQDEKRSREFDKYVAEIVNPVDFSRLPHLCMRTICKVLWCVKIPKMSWHRFLHLVPHAHVSGRSFRPVILARSLVFQPCFRVRVLVSSPGSDENVRGLRDSEHHGGWSKIGRNPPWILHGTYIDIIYIYMIWIVRCVSLNLDER